MTAAGIMISIKLIIILEVLAALIHSTSRCHAFSTSPTFRLAHCISNGRRQLFASLHVLTVLKALTTGDDDDDEEEVDVVVIGAGVGGLSCAALSAKYGMKTLCLEAHDTAGGVAHSFARYSSASKTIPFRFDSGPSLISGLSSKGTNPLRQVLDAIGTANEIEWKKYDGWIVHDYADNQSFKLTTGPGTEFEEAVEKKAGPQARQEFVDFKQKILTPGGLADASTGISPFSLRSDYGAIFTLPLFKLLSIGLNGLLLTGPFSRVMDLNKLNDPFLRKWFDYICFALSGMDADHTQAAPIAYMMKDLHSKGAILDYPMGGMDSLVRGLVSGMEKYGGELRLKNRVDRMLLKEGSNGAAECKGVVLSNGKVIKARKGVVCNAPLWNMARILNDSVSNDDAESVVAAVKEIQERANAMNMSGSFMHLHLGIPKDGLPDDLECHHSVLDFSKGITDEQNMVIISIPTVFDPSLAPEGYHIVHAYTAACDSFDQWETFLEGGKDSGKVGLDPNSMKAAEYARAEGYQQLKQEKAEVLWKAIECAIPDVRERAKRNGSITLIGTPLTHRRYNQRFRGTYGPAPSEGKDLWELPGAATCIQGLLCCGDTCFPGIGLPGVAASGTVAANTLTSTRKQKALIKELQEMGALQ